MCVLKPGDCSVDCGEGTQMFTVSCVQVVHELVELTCSNYTGCTCTLIYNIWMHTLFGLFVKILV